VRTVKLRQHLDTPLQLFLKYGGGVVALAALAVLMVSLYWTEHTVDDFRVIPFSNKFDWSPDGGSLSSTIVGMFINNGTRSAAVTKISVGIAQHQTIITMRQNFLESQLRRIVRYHQTTQTFLDTMSHHS
jgi:hypothetical protein